MKTLILIRHGKSDWSAGVSDKERPLNHRGRSDAPIMGNVLQHEGIIPERFYVSCATRASQTAQLLTEAMDISQDTLVNCPELYLCDSFTVEEIIRYAPDKYNTIAIIGHNPTLSHIAGLFSQQNYVDMPTLGVFVCYFNTDNWENISKRNAVKQQFFYPKLFK